MSIRSKLWEVFAFYTHLRFLGFVIFSATVPFFPVFLYFSEKYQIHIAILLSILVTLMIILPFALLFYYLRKRKKKIQKEVDEFFEKK